MMIEEKHYLYNLFSFASIFHFLIPFFFGFILRNRWFYVIPLLILFELLEQFSGVVIMVGRFYIFSPEPAINVISDVIIGSIALYLGYLIERKGIFKYKKK